MTASQTLTPSQAKFMQEHRERRARIAALAKPDTGIICLSASARSQRAEVPPVVELAPIPETPPVQQWAERQFQIHKPTWFSIVEEIDPPKTVKPTVGMIQRICAKYFDLSLNRLLSCSRAYEVVRPRQIAMFLAKEFTMQTLPEIGRRFEGKDHTTILHAVRKIAKKAGDDKQLADDLDALREQIRSAL